MDREEVKEFVENSFRDGYSVDEILELLKEEGVPEQVRSEAIKELRNDLSDNQKGERKSQELAGNQETKHDTISGVNLTEDHYIAKQRLLMNRYHIYDEDRNMVLKAKQKLFRLKENFPFIDREGNVVFRVKGEKIIDTAGDYAIVDEKTEKNILTLDKEFTLFRHKWKIRDPETEEVLANVRAKSRTVETLRIIGNMIPILPNIFGFIPHQYEIRDRDENLLATLTGRLNIRDIYDIEIKNSGKIPRESLVAATLVIDALEGN